MLSTADGLRRRLLAPIARAAPSLVVSRDARIGVIGSTLVFFALLVCGLAPGWALAIGPLVLGVPHVLSDVRYLVLRPGFHRRLGVAVPILAGITAATQVGVRGAIAGAAAAALIARGPWTRKVGLLAVAVALFALATWADWRSDVVFAHLHNFVALGFFCLWRPRGTRAVSHGCTSSQAPPGAARLWMLPLAVFVAGAAVIMAGATDGLALATRLGTFDLSLARAALAPDVEPVLAGRLLLLFAFAQSVHYVVWLGFVPAESRRRSPPPSFRQAVRGVGADLGPWLIVAGALASVVLVGWMFADVARARDAYLVAASFHGWLEVGAAFVFVAEGWWPVRRATDVRALVASA